MNLATASALLNKSSDAIGTTLPVVSLYAPDFIGFLLPPIIEILNKDVKDENKRFIVAFGLCLLAAALTKYNSLVMGDITSLVTSFGIIFAESQVIFKLYFKNSFVRAALVERLNRVEEPAG